MKKVLLLVLAVMLMASCLTVVHAEEMTPIQSDPVLYQAPHFDGEIRQGTPRTGSIYTDDYYYWNLAAASRVLREGIKQRAETIVVNIASHTFDESRIEELAGEMAAEMVAYASEHTGNPTEGDYLAWQYAGYYVYLDGYVYTGTYYLTFTFINAYFTTAQEEAQVDAAVAKLLPQLAGESDYDKVKAVYDWVTSNVTCTVMTDESDMLDFTAYGALVNKSANSLGIANLIYRLLLELGIDNRIIYGDVNGAEQYWNIVELEEEYYNLDAALDCGKAEYQYFLRCDANFGHTRNIFYDYEEFHAMYPMDDADYVPGTNKVLASGQCGKFADTVYWAFTSDSVLTISGSGEMADYYAPWHDRADQITQVVVEEGITHIGSQAFYNQPNTSAVSLPATVTSIGDEVFRECSSITTIALPEQLTSMGNGVFSDCSGLTEIILPDSVTEIGKEIFRWCVALQNIQLSANLKAIPAHAFAACISLKEISLPENLTELGEYAFSSCYALESIRIPDGVTVINAAAFESCDALVEVQLPAALTQIGSKAFSSCYSLTQLQLPNTLEKIGYSAFAYCRNLADITLPDGLTELGGSAFSQCYALESIRVPAGVKLLFSTFSGCTGLKEVELSEGLETIGDRAFNDCTSLVSIDIPNTVTSIEDNAFAYCPFTEVIIPNSVTKIESAFWCCPNLTKVTLSDSMTKISSRTFYGCSALTDVTLPSGITAIESEAFSGCTSLKSLTIPASVTSLGSYVVGGRKTPIELIFMGNPPAIAYDAFYRITCTAYYPRVNQNWTEDIMANYGGTVTWLPHDLHSHDYTTETVAPTCAEQGYTTYTCAECGDSYVADYVDALGHDFGEWYVTKEATCTEPGEEQHDCSRCDVSEAREIPVIDHTYESVVTAPTCAEQGYTTYACTECGETYADDYVDALGHSVSLWEVTTAPGCTDKGEESGLCDVCGETATRDVEPTDHSFEEGTCTVCGAPEIAPGDANGDGTVNNIDAMQVLQYAVGLRDADTIYLSVCDVNGDGVVNNIDAMRILQFAVGLITSFK